MKKSLQETNRHLKDPKKREEALTRNVRSSSAIEGITVKRDAETGRFLPSEKHSHKEGTPPETTLHKETKSSR